LEKAREWVVVMECRSLVSHELAVLPLAFVHSSRLVDEFAVTRSLPVKPIPDVVVAVRVDEPPEAVVDIVPELSFVDDVVDFFADACDLAIRTELSNNVLVVAALPELSMLVNLFLRVFHDVLQAKWAEFIPLVLGSLECNSVGILRPNVIEGILISCWSGIHWSLGLHNLRRLLTATHLVGLWKRLRR